MIAAARSDISNVDIFLFYPPQTCSHAFLKGNCNNRSMGMECEVGLRRKSYNVLTGGWWCLVITMNGRDVWWFSDLYVL